MKTKILCNDCGKDITEIIYEKGEDVVIQLNKYEIKKGATYLIAPYCRDCIKKITEELERY